MKTKALTVERLRELLKYDPETGIFTRKISTSSNARAESVAGTLHYNGYIQMSVDGVIYRANRLAFAYMTGNWPTAFVDHINGVRSDDRWSNLREATNSENLCNMRAHKDNASGVKGVSWHKSGKRWQAQLYLKGVSHHLGLFDCIEDAAAAVFEKRIEIHGEFARHA